MITVFADGRNITSDASDLTYSTVDPGGFEACSFKIPDYLVPPRVGASVLVLDGLSVLWEGLIEDPGSSNVQDTISAVGYGAVLKDNPYRMIYADRMLSNWLTDSPLNEKIRLAGLGIDMGSMSWTVDNQGMTLPFSSAVAIPQSSVAEAWYRAAPGCTVAKVIYRGSDTAVPAGYSKRILFLNVDNTGSAVDSVTPTMDDAIHTYTPSSPVVFVSLEMNSNGVSATPAAGQIRIFKYIGVYGPHGLTTRAITGEPDGVRPVDVAMHALGQQSTIVQGVVEADALNYIAPHVTYPTRSAPEQVIDDMSKLLGWHWGVWENTQMFGPPRLDFRTRPSRPTVIVSRRDCDNLELTQQRSNIYDKCVVSYTDADGIAGEVTVAIPNSLVPGVGRTLVVDGGTNTATQAQALATTQLQLAQAGQRGGGSPTLPYIVMTPGGSRKAHTIRAGLDRLRILDLRGSSTSFDDAQQFDSFRIARTETTFTNGYPTTTVEIDTGADLLEVLQARLASAAAAGGIQ